MFTLVYRAIYMWYFQQQFKSLALVLVANASMTQLRLTFVFGNLTVPCFIDGKRNVKMFKECFTW